MASAWGERRRLHHQHRRQRVAVEEIERLAETGVTLELGQRLRARDVRHLRHPREAADFRREFLGVGFAHVRFEKQRDLAVCLPAAAEALGVVHREIESARERERDADDGDGENGRERRAPETRQTFEQRFAMAPEPGFHSSVLRPVSVRLSYTSSPWLNFSTRLSRRAIWRWSWEAMSTVTP